MLVGGNNLFSKRFPFSVQVRNQRTSSLLFCELRYVSRGADDKKSILQICIWDIHCVLPTGYPDPPPVKGGLNTRI